jgi:hypothetical protein
VFEFIPIIFRRQVLCSAVSYTQYSEWAFSTGIIMLSDKRNGIGARLNKKLHKDNYANNKTQFPTLLLLKKKRVY